MALANPHAPERGLIVADPVANMVSQLETVLITGDLAKLTPDQRVFYYREVCQSVGLNPLTRPFDYLHLNGKLVLYANKSCTDQLRGVRRIEVSKLERERADDLAIVVAYVRDHTGRQDSAMGAVSIAGLKGEALANALMKAETKAKRRATLSISGLGLLDEIEVETTPGAWRADVDLETGELLESDATTRTLDDRLAAQAAEAAAVVTDAAGTMPAPAEEPGHVATGGTTSADHAPDPARTHAVASGAPDEASSAGAGAEGEAATSAPPTSPSPAQCESMSPYDPPSQCGKEQGHKGNHANRDRESWT